MSTFWSLFVIVLTGLSIGGCVWLMLYSARQRTDCPDGEELDHVWDGDLRELNQPLPLWWLILFYLTIIFSIGYLVAFPGLGSFAGVLGWTQETRYEQEMVAARAQDAKVNAEYADLTVAQLALNEGAVAIGQSVFVNNCATCHGSDGGGAPGFPSLQDEEWLYGADPDAIVSSISTGRRGIMPPLAGALGEQGVEQVIAYLRTLQGAPKSPVADEGQKLYAQFCVACHGPEAQGNPMLGAPNLANDIWLYGSSDESLRTTLNAGRNGIMPAHRDLLDEDRIRFVAAYVLSLSAGPAAP